MKDPKDRLRDIGDAWALLRDDSPAPSAMPSAGRKWLWPVAAATTFLWVRASSQPPPPLTRFEVAPARDMILNFGGVEPRWRRDGKELLYFSGRKLMAADVSLNPHGRVQRTQAAF